MTIAPGWWRSPRYCRLQLTSRNCLVEKEQKLPGGCPHGAVENPWKLSRVPVKCKWKPAGVPVELSWKRPLEELLKFAGAGSTGSPACLMSGRGARMEARWNQKEKSPFPCIVSLPPSTRCGRRNAHRMQLQGHRVGSEGQTDSWETIPW